ncbi:MAG: N-acetylmuramoyl-L-alanine amidase [Oscillospiraceae bacterium]|nr:N-acetylmuramoyl-L-alanine amidase [Oscillospiraceae bacterium]
MAIFIVLLSGCASSASEIPDTTPTTASTSAPTTAPTAPPLPITENLLPEDLSDPREEAITHIVIHFISAVTNHRENPFDAGLIRQIFLDAEISSHYLIARDGEIIRLVPEDRVAWHAGPGSWAGDEQYTNKMNRYAVGVELMGIGTRQEMSQYLSAEEYDRLDPTDIGFTDEQYQSLARLIADIRARHPGVLFDRAHILGHDEYNLSKPDPGELFDWERIMDDNLR